MGDPFRIRQIVENLLTNALKFTPAGNIGLRAALENGQLHFSVSDTGCGISEEEQKRIFHEFTRLHNAQGQEGFGLGLAITRKLVLLLGGEIRIESEQGKGSTFHVYLPLPEASDTTPTDSKKPDDNKEKPKASVRSLHLILIDDDRIQLQLTRAMLEHTGITVTCCEHPDELFHQLKEKTFSALLTDIQMPAMNGFELLKAIRDLDIAQARTLPVIAITARSDMDEAYFRSQGFAGCLHKPFTTAELMETIAALEEMEIPEEESPAPALADSASGLPDFSALTAFSADDPEAAAEIMQTFIAETRQNHERLEQALAQQDVATITAIAHKLLPLFTMLGIKKCIPSLVWLEQHRQATELTDEAADKATAVMEEIKEVLRQAEEHVQQIFS